MDMNPLSFWKRVGAVLSPIVSGDDVTTTGTVTAEQLTSTDDITMQGHLLALGDGATATDVVIQFNSSVATGIITYLHATNTFDFNTANFTDIGTVTATTFTDGTLTITGGDITDANSLGDGTDTLTMGSDPWTLDGGIRCEDFGVGTDPSHPVHIVMSATDTKGLYIDGATNDYTGTGNGFDYCLHVERDLNAGDGNEPTNVYGASINLFPKHTSGVIDSNDKDCRGISTVITDTSKWDITGAASKYVAQRALYAEVINTTGALESTGAGAISYFARGLVSNVDLSPTVDGGAATNVLSAYGISSIVANNPTLSTGDLDVYSAGVFIDVDGNAAGDSTAWGIYIQDVSGADTNYGIYIKDVTDYGIYDASGTAWHMTGTISCGALTATGTVQAEHLYSTDDLVVDGLFNIAITTSTEGQILQNATRIFHTFVPTDQAPTYRNVFIGYSSGNFTMNNIGAAHHGTGNVAVGASCLDAITTGFYNFALGTNALTDLTDGHSNIAIGHIAGANVTTGDLNVFIGRESGFPITTGIKNVGIGATTFGSSVVGTSNSTAIGWNAGRNSQGSRNIFIGYAAGMDETASDTFLLDNEDRTSEALSRTLSLMYGLLENHASGPWLRVNGDFDVGNATTGRVTRLGDGGDTDYSQFAADGELTLHGTARVTNALWIGAEGLKAPPTKSASFVDHGAICGAWEFSDAVDDTIVANMRIPDQMDRSVAPSITLGWSSTTQSAFCEWQIEYLWRSVNEDTTAGADDTLLSSTDADASTSSATAEGMVVSTFLLVAPSATDVCIHLRIKRRGDLAADTINGDTVELHGICMTFTSNKLGTAT